MMTAILLAYVVVGAILLVLLVGFDEPAVTAAFRRDLRALRAHGSLAVMAGGPVWVAGAVAAWPVVAACEAINWRDRS
ncbi:hypothetical protein [Pseudonocardia zijingensis]|jgi:hypothetical protein|uniref:Uncharacterized protein n=1 Tax=Pseudonocardia zijingensis TaxID=153376 RepID=A0ABN1PB92_9PSEU